MIVASAGHVDHGKTSLVKQLTGVDTDRLAEEKKRGLSIDLGFAYRPHPQHPGHVLGFIDVPGHQRFINTMISGVSGIDLGMLVVAADDGIMPQTLEHLDVLRLLGIRECIGVITKTDRVEAGRVQAVQREVRALLEKNFGHCLALFPVSNMSGDGVAALQAWLDEKLLSLNTSHPEQLFRMTVDRVFSLKGVGLVVTGTILSGAIQREENIRLLPAGKSLRIRSLHAQDREVGEARQGQRCALNLAGDAGKDAIVKGDWLVGAGSGEPTQCFTASLDFLETPVALKHGMQVKLYMGAAHVAARLGLASSATGLVQVFTTAPVSCVRGDRFLLRDYSEQFLLGGGVVLDPWARRSNSFSPDYLGYLDALKGKDFTESLRKLAVDAGQVIDYERYRKAWNLGSEQARAQLDRAGLTDVLVFSGQYVLTAENWQAMLTAVHDRVIGWHQAHRDRPGMPLAELETDLPGGVDGRLLPAILSELQQRGLDGRSFTLANGIVSASGFAQEMPESVVKLWQQVEAILRSQGLEIPLVSELENRTRTRGREMNFLISHALKTGRLVRISPKRVGLPETLKVLAERVRELGA